MRDSCSQHAQRRDAQQQERQQAKAHRPAGDGRGDNQRRMQRARHLHLAETRRAIHDRQAPDEHGPGRSDRRRGVDQDPPGAREHAPSFGGAIQVGRDRRTRDLQAVQPGLRRITPEAVPEDRVLARFLGYLAGIVLGLDFDLATYAGLHGDKPRNRQNRRDRHSTEYGERGDHAHHAGVRPAGAGGLAQAYGNTLERRANRTPPPRICARNGRRGRVRLHCNLISGAHASLQGEACHDWRMPPRYGVGVSKLFKFTL